MAKRKEVLTVNNDYSDYPIPAQIITPKKEEQIITVPRFSTKSEEDEQDAYMFLFI